MAKIYTKKQIVVKHKRGNGHYTIEEFETLKRMRLGGFSDKEIDLELGRPRGSAFAKANKLGLARAHIRETTIPKEGVAPTQGIVKCHNCLEEIKLTKGGLGKKYLGATRIGKWLFWHLPGQCTGDPNAHADLLHEDRPSLDSPGHFWVTKGEKN
ncbi:unnamed protein product [marine sediment metagenome]|uniref:Uncharacterized protein n=1 Tax=marine sediment metagenome TaxID=412755 RepID=X0WH97_9ZZZZ